MICVFLTVQYTEVLDILQREQLCQRGLKL